jgi:hypothetical protein
MSVVFAYCTVHGRSGVVTTLSLLNTIRAQHDLEKKIPYNLFPSLVHIGVLNHHQFRPLTVQSLRCFH